MIAIVTTTYNGDEQHEILSGVTSLQKISNTFIAVNFVDAEGTKKCQYLNLDNFTEITFRGAE